MAMPSVTLAFSPFWVIEAVICSTEALVSSTLAACSLAAWLIDCAVALTSSEAEDSASALARTSPTTCDSLAVMRLDRRQQAGLVALAGLDVDAQVAAGDGLHHFIGVGRVATELPQQAADDPYG